MYSEKRALKFASLAEVVTGWIALIDPVILVRLLFGAEIAGAGTIVARILGASLLGLGVSCWPGSWFVNIPQTVLGILIYSFFVTFYFGYLGITGQWVGLLLWPAILLHASLTFLLCLGLCTSKL